MTKKEIYSRFRHAKIVEVLKIEVNEGEGTSEDPIQRVAYYLTKGGKVIGNTDDTKRKFAGEDEMIKT